MPVTSRICSHSYRPEQPIAPRDEKAVAKQVLLCQICEKSGDGIVQCSGPCGGMFHRVCTGHSSHDGSYLCEECYTGKCYFVIIYQLLHFVVIEVSVFYCWTL